MPLPIIRPFYVYYKTRKIAEIVEGTYDIDTGDEPVVCIEGYVGDTDGPTLTRIDATVIVPQKGVRFSVLADALTKFYVDVGILGDGKSHQIRMRVRKLSYVWESRTGRAIGKFTLGGGGPDIANVAEA